MRAETKTNEHLLNRWAYYVAADIKSIQIDLRSIFNHIAHIVGLLLPKPGQASTRFGKLLEWASENASRLDLDLRNLLLAQRELFMDVQRIRNSLVHFGGHVLVFGQPSEGILFQVYDGPFSQHVSGPALMLNENVAHFDRYAALVLARLLLFLENLGELVKEKRGVTDMESGFGVRSYCPGFQVIRSWMEDLLPRLRSFEATSSGTC